MPCVVHARLSGPSIECGIPSFDDESSRVLAALFLRLPITTSKVPKGRKVGPCGCVVYITLVPLSSFIFHDSPASSP